MIARLVDRKEAAVEGGGAQRRKARLADVTGNLRFVYLVEKVQSGFLFGWLNGLCGYADARRGGVLVVLA